MSEALLNEDNYVKNVSFLRHTDFLSQDTATQTIVIIGCGAVGSNIALNLAKMGYTHFVLYDKDIVESHNLPNQAYWPAHIGMNKVDALAQVLQSFNPVIQVEKHCDWFCAADAAHVTGGFVVVATDSMSSRKMIFEVFKLSVVVDALIEVRLGFEYGNINIVNPLDVQQVDDILQTIVPDDQVSEGPCSRKICATFVSIMSGLAAHVLCDTSNDIANAVPPKQRKYVVDVERKLFARDLLSSKR